MPFIQFRIHPAVGCARMGNSAVAYHLASEFPYFLQEEFSNLRFMPKPRKHPKAFLADDAALVGTESNVASFNIYDTTATFQNKFKEDPGKIFPQAARFRVFAYVYDDERSPHPQKVFEVTTDVADITWSVNIANKKSAKAATSPAPDENLTSTATDLNTAAPTLTCKRIRPKPSLPTLAYIFLERDDADKTKVTGRLHVIGNEGEFVGSADPTSLWSDDWYDSAGDGPVEAVIKPKTAPFFAKAGISSGAADLQYLDYQQAAPKAGSTMTINAMPAWVVVACPDYVPDMGHFVSLWDMAFSRAIVNTEVGTVVAQPGKHKLITNSWSTERYKKTDYLIHIHPQLCLFEDVKFVSGEAFGMREADPTTTRPRAHNSPTSPGPPPPAAADDKKTESDKVEHGGVSLMARTNKAALADPKKLKDPDPKKPIADWLKIAVFKRLRKPDTLYDTKRKFHVKLPGSAAAAKSTAEDGVFPRRLGRRMDYDKAPGTGDKNKVYRFPHEAKHNGDLREFHGLADAGSLCGRAKSPPMAGPPGSSLSAAALANLALLDDIYWPANAADMPMLRELAYTAQQYEQFRMWQASDVDVRSGNILDNIVPSTLKTTFNAAGEADGYFAALLAARPAFAPAMIDMAHLGAMLGGSFLPGIEVGREGGISANWCMFHGASRFFPSIRFKPADTAGEHKLGALTKDLAIPWSEDFAACDETYWPTARPGMTSKDGTARHRWLMARSGGTAKAQYVKDYWKVLGFIRRDAANKFIEQEQTWH